MAGKIKKDLSWAHGVRSNGARRARMTHVVKSVTKSGAISKMPLSASDWQHNAFDSAEKAEKRRAELEKMNPGRRFAVVEL